MTVAMTFISGDRDHIMPPSVQKSNAKHYKSDKTVTEVELFEGPHLMVAAGGWEKIADRARMGRAARAVGGYGLRVTELRLTHVGGPTLLVEVAGWRLLTDPTFDAPGKKYKFGWGTSSVKLAGPSMAPGEVGPLDAILLSHDHHDDNLDAAGRTLLPTAGVVVTTVPGRGRLTGELGGRVRGLADWETTALEAPGKPTVTITATPCRHGPPGSHPIVGDVIGFALSWEGQTGGVLWISGDTVLYDGVREVAERLDVDVAVVHLGGVQFPVSGPLRYTMTGADAVELMGLVKPRVAIPIHYEGWKHFRDDRAHVEAAIAAGPADVRERFRWLTIGEPTMMGG